MKILVCVKEVFGTGILDSNQRTYPGKRQPQMNSYDFYAIEEGVLLKEKFPGTRVDALTAGPEGSSPVIRKALEMGADNGIHILLDESSSTESSSVASSIADFIGGRSYDLIITGVLSEDTLQGEMGGLLSGKLGIPYIHSVMKLDIDRAEVIVTAGRGAGDEDGIALVKNLAALFKQSAVGATRPVCDRGLLPYTSQVGSTGRKVSPSLYLACGVSGSSQHIAGMRESDLIVSINSDHSAPITAVADYVVVEDLSGFIPVLIEKYRDRCGSG